MTDLIELVEHAVGERKPRLLPDEGFFTFTAEEENAVPVKELKLPADAKVICYYRDGKFSHADEETAFRMGDEVVILTHSKNMSALQES